MLLALLLLGILITVHEFGHFASARACGIPVKEFSIGFGPKLVQWKSKKHETLFSIRPIPLGGFCMFYGDTDDDPDGTAMKDDPRNYNNAAVISANDYFTLNQYDGKIYKTVNLQGKVLANYCETDSALAKEQKRIEKEITTLQNNVWGKDSTKLAAKTDTTLNAATNQTATAKPARTSSRSTKAGKTESESTSSRSQLKREKSNAQPRFSARRQRH